MLSVPHADEARAKVDISESEVRLEKFLQSGVAVEEAWAHSSSEEEDGTTGALGGADLP